MTYYSKPQRAAAAFSRKKEKPAEIITPALREALARLLEDDPEAFVEACVKAQITSLKDIPAFQELTISDPWQASIVTLMASDRGIPSRR